MFRASSAHLQEDTIVHVQHMVLSLCKQVSGRVYSPVYRVTLPYAARVQLCPPEDEHLKLETCRGEYYFMNK